MIHLQARIAKPNLYPQFITKKGLWTYYALACGYVERHKIDEKNYIILYMEHNHFHVQIILNGLCDHQQWQVFDANELTNARKYFNQLKKQLVN